MSLISGSYSRAPVSIAADVLREDMVENRAVAGVRKANWGVWILPAAVKGTQPRLRQFVCRKLLNAPRLIVLARVDIAPLTPVQCSRLGTMAGQLNNQSFDRATMDVKLLENISNLGILARVRS